MLESREYQAEKRLCQIRTRPTVITLPAISMTVNSLPTPDVSVKPWSEKRPSISLSGGSELDLGVPTLL